MRKLITMTFLTMMLGSFAYVQAERGHGHGDHKMEKAAQGEKKTIKGEILDMACYMGHEGKGKKHQKCAKDCILKNHQPMGLLTDDGDVYLLVEDHAKRKPYISLKEKAAETVTVTGKVFKRGGVQAVVVTGVQ